MPLILAVEPDRRQAAHLTQIVRQRVGAELVLAETTELALAQIGNRVPDLILVPPLLSPTDDAALGAALRVIASAAHVQMLTTPLFASAAPEPKRGVLAVFRRAKPTKPATDGCDPAEFAQQISSYLEAAAEQRATAQYIEPPIPVRATTPPPAAEAPQRYVPLEPGRLYRDEFGGQEPDMRPAAEILPEPALSVPEVEPIAEIAEPLAALEPEQVPVYEPPPVEPYVERIYQPLDAHPEQPSETSEATHETSAPALDSSELIYEPLTSIVEEPAAVETTETTVAASEPTLAAHEAVFEAAAPVFETLEPVYEAPEPVYATPEPVHATPEPVYEAPEPVYAAPEPVHETLEPVHETPEPAYEAPEPVYATPEPVHETLEPVYEVPEQALEAPASTFEIPEPLAAREPAQPRRIGFVLNDEDSDLAAFESLDLEVESIDIAASADTPFVVEALSDSDTIEAFSASSDDEAIELVDVDLSADFSEFEDVHVVQAQSDEEVVEIIGAPAVDVEAVAPETPGRVIETDALKEFAAAVEALTASEQAVSTDRARAEARAFEFDDLFPPRQAVEPSPLSSWRSWATLEGIDAEAWEPPAAPQAVEQTAQPVAERPDWVQLIESLRVDVQRRRSEQPSTAQKTARKAPSRPVQDEWGLFDPAQCGFAALLAKLDEITDANESRHSA